MQDPSRLKEILGATATLEFRMVDDQNSVQEALAGTVPVTSELFQDRDGRPVLTKKSIMLTGEYIIDASSGIDTQSGSPAVFITLDGKGASLFSRRTRDKIVVAGHWAALGHRLRADLVALDSGCVYGGALTAIRLEDREVYVEPNRDAE